MNIIFWQDAGTPSRQIRLGWINVAASVIAKAVGDINHAHTDMNISAANVEIIVNFLFILLPLICLSSEPEFLLNACAASYSFS